METYEKHEFPKGMLDPPASREKARAKGEPEPDPMRELAALTDTSTDNQHVELQIAKVQRWERIREREVLRPMEDKPGVGPKEEVTPLPSLPY
jgi:hypothetical protein